MDDLEFCEAVNADRCIRAGDLYLKFGGSLSDIRTRWIHTVVLEILGERAPYFRQWFAWDFRRLFSGLLGGNGHTFLIRILDQGLHLFLQVLQQLLLCIELLLLSLHLFLLRINNTLQLSHFFGILGKRRHRKESQDEDSNSKK